MVQDTVKTVLYSFLLLFFVGEISCSSSAGEGGSSPGVGISGREAFRRGIGALKAKRYSTAVSWFKRAEQLGFARCHTLTGQGLALSGMGKLEQAKRRFTRAITANPNLPEPWIRRGLILHHQDNYGAALSDFNRGVALAPGHALGLMGRSFTLNSLKRYGEALRDARAAQRAGAVLPLGYMAALKAR